MKPLVLWCRWHDAKLRLAGRSAEAVWGEIDFWKEARREPFHFDLHTHHLKIGITPDQKILVLDEMGVDQS